MFDKELPQPPEPPLPHGRHKLKHKRMRVIVKGYMRPDGSSYHVVIPKKIREMMELEGGEYFLMAASPRRDEIRLRRVDFFDDEETGLPAKNK
ncbi:MAG: AbrB/MazE/SpoVT family DNA-binding domain-containing protein [Promethearchaeota archaeon]